MLNPSYVGRSLPATQPVTITAQSVAAFARSLGFADESTPPPTYLISLTLPASNSLVDDPDFGLDFTRVLHREQRFNYLRPVEIGHSLTCTVTVESIKTVAGNELLSLRTDVAEEGKSGDEAQVAKVWTTLFVAGDAAMEGK
ncbi:FAS1-like dehydratase domain-containing protein [Natronoglycomyces albus]|uniref:MaoC family dehydratase N-terminal domain-containing protein n=1 Tax=Natronoglycomyces albus TaxID=2811108 RepID=A0A895XFV8_9ACTN|nr:MaoC family dehydratase N-terminal domain-containing protein [Natronoglycomyces albus]QSB04741.1 MaoC family dehydratase N-terminal domain-containing protein [Natronoglycomyces albus]